MGVAGQASGSVETNKWLMPNGPTLVHRTVELFEL